MQSRSFQTSCQFFDLSISVQEVLFQHDSFKTNVALAGIHLFFFELTMSFLITMMFLFLVYTEIARTEAVCAYGNA